MLPTSAGLNLWPHGLQLDGASNWATKAGSFIFWLQTVFLTLCSASLTDLSVFALNFIIYKTTALYEKIFLNITIATANNTTI